MRSDPLVTQDEQRAAEETCRSVYDEVSKLYDDRAPRVGGKKLGYRILYGPPVVRPKYLFLGYQPGGKANSLRMDQHRGWPSVCEYALDKPRLRAAGWDSPTLAVNMQKVWGAPTLKHCTGLNAIFFRAPSMEDWKRVRREQREELERFSLERAQRIVKMFGPKRLTVVGLGSFELLTKGLGCSVLVCRGRALIKRGELWGVPAFGVIHLSGARVSGADLEAMKAYFAELDAN
jgi:hypothetical protein